MLKKEHYEIFKECFPELTLTKAQLEKLLDIEKCHITECVCDGIVTGFAVIYRNFIRLICVESEYRCQGAGSFLINECEEKIKSAGFDEIIIGGMDSSLFMGAVTSEDEFDHRDNIFFRKRGYKAEHGCIEMKLSLKDYNVPENEIDYVTFGFYDGDKEALYDAVGTVDKEWVQYFTNADKVYTAMYKGKIAGFCIIGYQWDCVLSGDNIKVGSVGCVGVVHEFRKQGIGLEMVNRATHDLKENGCDLSFIHFTYLEDWYGKLGYRTFIRYWFGHKNI